MSSAEPIFVWKLIPIGRDEAIYNRLGKEHTGDCINILVNVKHQLCPNDQTQHAPPSRIPFDCYVDEIQSFFLPSQEILENVSSWLRLFFPHPIVPQELMDRMMPELITSIKEVIQNSHSAFHDENCHFRLFSFRLEIHVVTFYDADEDELVPTSETAIKSLVKKVKLEGDVTIEKCTICLTEFREDMEVSAMPCKHVYHKECLVQWLKTSHVCPLCRYPLPTSSIE